MDRFLYYLIGAAAALLLLLVGAAVFFEFSAQIRNAMPFGKSKKPIEAAQTQEVPETPQETLPDDRTHLDDYLPPAPTPQPWLPVDVGETATIVYPGFTVLYSVTLGTPLMVQYAMVNGAEPKIYPEPIKVITPSPSLISKGGFSPGPLALPKSIGLYFGKTSVPNTSLMTNVCPFYPSCLEGPWSKFEDLEKHWAGTFGWIEVAAGPLLQSPPARVEGLVIPSAFFRAYRRAYGDTLAFIIPQTASNEPLQAFLTSIEEIEKASGLKIFPNTVTGEERRIKAKGLW